MYYIVKHEEQNLDLQKVHDLDKWKNHLHLTQQFTEYGGQNAPHKNKCAFELVFFFLHL